MKIKLTLLIIVSALIHSANAAQWYVNQNIGDDLLDGTSATLGGGTIGPKKTINAALLFASYSDTINIADGLYEEILVIDKALVIRGNNWGIDPLTTARNAETIIVSPVLSTNLAISGNTLIEIKSCCVELDGLQLSGDNPNLITAATKYGKEYEISYSIAGEGNFDNLHFTNLIISNFVIAGINMGSGLYATKSNFINKCFVKVGEDRSIGILFNDNYYSDIANVNIDSTGSGIIMDSFSDKTGQLSSFSFLTIRSEIAGVSIVNFTGNTDSLYFENSNVSPLDPLMNYSGFWLNNISATGHFNLLTTIINNASKGILIEDCYDKFVITISDNTFTNGNTGIYWNQSSLTTAVTTFVRNCKFNGMDSSALFVVSEGGLATYDLSDILINNTNNGIIIKGRSTILPTNTQFNMVSKYYIFLDTSAGGIKPLTNINATSCVYEGVIGYNLTNRDPFKVEDKIRHYLDRTYLGWVLFKNNSLYVTTNDGNYFLTPAVKVALNNWNIYLDSINSSEFVTIDKRINLYTDHDAGIGKIIMDNTGALLFLHGKLFLNNGLELKRGIIEVTNSDTLLVYRSNTGTVLTPGTVSSFVRGTLYVRYRNLPVNYSIRDTIPIGWVNDFRPFYITATWPAGLSYFDIAFKTVLGKAAIKKLPPGITHISDVRYWQLINPFNQTGFNIKNAGVSYAINDQVNDPSNLRLIYDDFLTTYNLGGTGSGFNTGSIMSTTGTPGYGLYAMGNALGGNNVLSPNEPIALINTVGNCNNDSVLISAENSRSVPFINTWEWSVKGPSTVITTENAPKIMKLITVPGQYTITLIITNKMSLKDTATYLLTILPKPTIQYTALLPCFPAAIDLTNTSILPPSTFIINTEWLMNSIFYTTPNLKFSPTAPGIQSGHLKVTLNTGCSDSLLISITSPAVPVITLKPNGKDSICSGDSLVVQVTNSGGVLTWNDGKTHNDSLILKTNSYYKATVTASPQCSRTDSIALKILSMPTVNAGSDLKTLPGKPVELKAVSNGMVEWSPVTWLNDATVIRPVARPLVTTTYTLRAYTVDGCEAKDSMTVFIDPGNNPFIPNLLTPNGDGHNDKWVLSNVIDPKNCTVNIFTREGMNIYTSDSYNNSFDGTRSGSVLPDGFYVYIIENKVTGKVSTGMLNILSK